MNRAPLIAALALCPTLVALGPSVQGPCPDPEDSLVIETRQLVVCGYVVERRLPVVHAAEFRVLVRATGKRLLELGATEDAELRAVGDDLQIVRVAKWPFGRHWAWTFVPISQTVVSARGGRLVWQPRLSTPQVTPSEITQFLRNYQARVRRQGRAWAPSEEVVGRLFTAMVAGDSVAASLFRSMPRDVSLDGVTAEDYQQATEDYDAGRRRTPSN